MKKDQELRDKLLIGVFDRLVNASGKSSSKYFNAVPHDRTDGTNTTVYAFMDIGFDMNVGPQDIPAPQLLEIHIQKIWGAHIRVYDYLTGQHIMECYYDNQTGWCPCRTLYKPQYVLRRLVWEAKFLNKTEAEDKRLHWDDEEMDDPMGCPSQYI